MTGPLARLEETLARARALDPDGWNAMTLATVGPDGRPQARIVLLKDLDDRGVAFYTNLGSRKSQALRAHAFAALVLHWPRLEEQARLEGRVEAVSEAEADAYFATRPRGSQIGAWASRQSAPLDVRATLDLRVEELERRFHGSPVPRPPFWGGWRLVPDRIEFWRAHPSRLHDRDLYVPDDQGGWRSEKLYP